MKEIKNNNKITNDDVNHFTTNVIELDTDSNENVSPRYNHYEGAGVAVNSKDWVTIATSTTGFGCNVQINTFNTRINYVSVLMLGQDGKEVWSEINAIPYGKCRVFYCGTNVRTIQVKCVGTDNTSTISCWPTDRDVGIYTDPYIM